MSDTSDQSQLFTTYSYSTEPVTVATFTLEPTSSYSTTDSFQIDDQNQTQASTEFEAIDYVGSSTDSTTGFDNFENEFSELPSTDNLDTVSESIFSTNENWQTDSSSNTIEYTEQGNENDYLETSTFRDIIPTTETNDLNSTLQDYVTLTTNQGMENIESTLLDDTIKSTAILTDQTTSIQNETTSLYELNNDTVNSARTRSTTTINTSASNDNYKPFSPTMKMKSTAFPKLSKIIFKNICFNFKFENYSDFFKKL